MNRRNFGTRCLAVFVLGCTLALCVNALPPTAPKGKKWVKNWDMSDEFNRKSDIYRNKWVARALPAGSGTWLGRQPGFFNPANIGINGSHLRLRAKKQQPSQVYPALKKQVEAHNAQARKNKEFSKVYKDFSTSYIRTTKTQRFGYFEIRCKMAKSKIASAFWLKQANTNGWTTEIDVFEYGHGKSVFNASVSKRMNMNHHVQKFGGTHAGRKPRSGPDKRHGTKFDLSKGMHVYGVHVTNSYVRWYFNNEKVHEIKNDFYKQPMHVVLDRETFPNWFGLPGTLNKPDVFEVDWVRVWRLK